MPMKKIEKYWLTVLWIALLMSSISVAEYSEEMQDAYDFAYKNGITTMDSIDQADMEGNLTRIAMAKMMSQYAINVLDKIPDNQKKCTFDDVSQELEWSYHSWATLACQLWLMGKGWAGKFNPYSIVTRAEFWTVLSRLLYQWEDGDPLYYAPHLAKLKEEGIIKNDDPNLKEQRGFLMLMLMRSKLLEDFNELYSLGDIPKNMIPTSYGKRFYFHNDYNNPALSQAMEKMHLRSTYCPYIFCERENENWEYSNLRHYYRDEEKEEMIILPGVTYVSDCSYYDDSMRQKNKEKVVKNKEDALQIMLKELNLESEKDKIVSTDLDCFSPFWWFYDCSFFYEWKRFQSLIDEQDWTFMPLERMKAGSRGIANDDNGQNVMIYEMLSSDEEDEIKKILEKYYQFIAVDPLLSVLWEDGNTIVIYQDNEREYYIDRATKSKIHASEDLLSLLEKDSGVPKDIIAEQSNYNYIYHDKWDYGENKEILFVYDFEYQGAKYEYKVNPIDWKIVEYTIEYSTK